MMKLIVGLGNIGSRYARTRHNIGFMVTDALASTMQATWSVEGKLDAAIATTEQDGQKIILAKPQTMMNLSGRAVQKVMQYYKVAPSDVWVIFDDVDIPFGKMRLRTTGSSGGHQGLSSTIQYNGPDFVRARMGVSLNDRTKEPSEVYVLKPFTSEEQKDLPELIHTAAGIVREQLAQVPPPETTFTLLPDRFAQTP